MYKSITQEGMKPFLPADIKLQKIPKDFGARRYSSSSRNHLQVAPKLGKQLPSMMEAGAAALEV